MAKYKILAVTENNNMTTKNEIQNVYAFNKEFKEIHISDAVSGRNGYFCLGCQREMQARKSEIQTSYFCHDFTASKGQQKCNYSDETYRHKLAKLFLINNKAVKVPTLYKFPPKNIEGNPNLIAESKFIYAYSVEPELYFYENENSKIIWSKTFHSTDNKYLLFKPDIAFFDSENNPILLIEIIATHKITEKKLLDLKRLGIDSIQITIPKDSPENIEKTLKTTIRTKWIYNYEQEIREYIQNSVSDSEGISSIDFDQKKFFEESFKCRASQINTIIRTITKYLESEQYRTIARGLESEISRIENNTKQYRESNQQLQERNDRSINELRNEIRVRIYSKHGERRNRIDSDKREFENADREFRKSCVEQNKKDESELNKLEDGIRNGAIEQYRERREEFAKRKENLEERYNRKNTELQSNTSIATGIINELKYKNSTIDGDIERERKFIEDITRKFKEIERITIFEHESIKRNTDYRNNLENKYRELENTAQSDFDNDKRKLELGFQELRDDFTEAIKKRSYSGNGFTSGFKKTIDDIYLIPYFVNAKINFRRYEKAWDCFTKGRFKTWLDRK